MESKQFDKIKEFLTARVDYDLVKDTASANQYINYEGMLIDSKQPYMIVSDVAIDLEKAPNTKLKFGYFNRIVSQRVGYAFGRDCTFSRDADVCSLLFDMAIIRKCAWFISLHGYAWMELKFDDEGVMTGIAAHDAGHCFEFIDGDTGSRAFIIVEDVNDEFGMPSKEIQSVRVIQDLEADGGAESFQINQYMYVNDELIETEWMRDVVVEKRSVVDDGILSNLTPAVKRNASDIVMRLDSNPFRVGVFKEIKGLADEYDRLVSETFDFVKGTPRNPLKVSGYNTSLEQLAHNIAQFNILPMDSDGSAEVLETKQDIGAVTQLLTLIETAMYDITGAVQSGGGGNISYSGTALRMKYGSLDIAAQYLQAIMTTFFKRCRPYMSDIIGEETLDVIFNSDIIVNESDTIVNSVNSRDIISLRTILENHPWVNSVDEELKRLTLEGRVTNDGSLDSDGDGFVEVNELDVHQKDGVSLGASNTDAMADGLNPDESTSVANNQKRIASDVKSE